MAPRAKSAVARRPAASPSAIQRKPAAKVAKGGKPVARPAGRGGSSKGAALKKPAAGRAAAGEKKPAAARQVQPWWKQCGRTAKKVQTTYFQNCEFPQWSQAGLAKGLLDSYAKTVVMYYTEGDDLGKVGRMLSQREPANVEMHRCYDEDLFEERFGWRRGAYAESTTAELMPNIAIYCRTPMQSSTGEQKDVHVINVVGYAFDSKDQPDWKYFLPLHNNRAKWDELVRRKQQMWRYIFECAKRHSLKRVYLADVGGGAFSTGLQLYEETSYQLLKEASLPPVQREFEGVVESHTLQRIPDWCFTEEAEPLLSESLLVNAWDPWSLVGNANRGDNSLDGFFGRCTAMAVLCWPKTNPHIRWESVAPAKGVEPN